jgi:hypothetical protein
MNLTAQIDRWEAFWEKTSDTAEIERQLVRLRWLEDFAFACRESLEPDCYRAVKQEIAVVKSA